MYDEQAKKSSFAEFINHTASVSGHTVDQESYEKSCDRKALLEEISDLVANDLEKGGHTAYDENQNLTIVGASGETKEVKAYRNINIIPLVAQKNRARMLKCLEYFCETRVNDNQLRMWVFNLGARTPLGDVRDRIKLLHSNINRLAYEIKKKYGIDIFFRSTELGSVQKSEGVSNLHLHTHCLVKTPYLKDWSEVVSWINKRWRELCKLSPNSKWSVFKESGSIYKIREACKYVIKPMELMELSSSEICQLYEQTKGLHIVQARGDFKKARSNFKVTSSKPVRRWNGKEYEWRVVKNVNAKTDAEKELIRCAKLLEQNSSSDSQLEPADNVILSLLEPSCFFSPVFEPAFLVRNYTPKFFERHQSSSVSAVVAAYEDGKALHAAVAAGGQSVPYKVHNRTITVNTEPTAQPKGEDLQYILSKIHENT